MPSGINPLSKSPQHPSLKKTRLSKADYGTTGLPKNQLATKPRRFQQDLSIPDSLKFLLKS
jgi:hypothetical protein